MKNYKTFCFGHGHLLRLMLSFEAGERTNLELGASDVEDKTCAEIAARDSLSL